MPDRLEEKSDENLVKILRSSVEHANTCLRLLAERGITVDVDARDEERRDNVGGPLNILLEPARFRLGPIERRERL